MSPPLDLSVYLVADAAAAAGRDLPEIVAAAVRGGASAVQLRDKTGSDAEMIAMAETLKAVLAGTGVPLIVNDRIAVARAVAADGLHVGQSDAGAEAARAGLGPSAIIGVSVETLAHAAAVDPALADYAGAGPVFATPTKPDHAPPIGFSGLAEICAAAAVPVVAIGGLGAGHARDAIRAGAQGIAVVSAICAADDPEAAARAIADAVRAAR